MKGRTVRDDLEGIVAIRGSCLEEELPPRPLTEAPSTAPVGRGLSDRRRQGDSGDVDGATLIVAATRRPDGRVASLGAFPRANRRGDT